MKSHPKRHSEQKFTISKEELNALPLKAFNGPVDLITDAKHAAKAFREVMAHDVVGFDTETRPSFHKGQRYDVSLIQLALPTKVYLVRLNFTGIVEEMIHLLENENIVKAGVGIRDDLKALQKLHPFTPDGFYELSTMAKEIGIEVESVKKLAGLLLGFRISKSAQTSNWEAENYTDKQISYAATDAWVCLEIYREISRKIK